jgi:Cyclic nucleotide-binding domain/Sigma-70, region 4
VVDSYRRAQRLSKLDNSNDGGEEDKGFAEVLDRLSILSAVREVIACQPPRRRAVAVLFFVEERGYEEIATILDITESTVPTHVERMRGLLKTYVDWTIDHDRGGDWVVTSSSDEAARRLLRLAHESDPDQMNLDVEAGLADLQTRVHAQRRLSQRAASISLDAGRLQIKDQVMPAASSEPSRGFWGELSMHERAAWQAASSWEEFLPGTTIFAQHDTSDHVAIIWSGLTKVVVGTDAGHEVVLALRGPGDIIGEMAVIGDGRRSATVTSIDRVEALLVEAPQFLTFLNDFAHASSIVSSRESCG